MNWAEGRGKYLSKRSLAVGCATGTGNATGTGTEAGTELRVEGVGGNEVGWGR